MCIFAIDFNGEITKRYARSADRNVGTFYSKAELVWRFTRLAWAGCIFSLQGLSYNLYPKKSVQHHASFIVAQRGAEER